MKLKKASTLVSEYAIYTCAFFYFSGTLEKEPGGEVARNLKAFLDISYANDLTYSTTEESHRAVIYENLDHHRSSSIHHLQYIEI